VTALNYIISKSCNSVIIKINCIYVFGPQGGFFQGGGGG